MDRQLGDGRYFRFSFDQPQAVSFGLLHLGTHWDGRSTPSLEGVSRYLNQSAVASAMRDAVQTGASRQYSMFSNIILTPSAIRTFGSQPSSRRILAMSAQVQ